jgi:hypothetical protein
VIALCALWLASVAVAAPVPAQTLTADATFAGGSAMALGIHESGHVIFDIVFSAGVQIKGVHLGPFPFFAISHRSDLPARDEFVISSAGFWMQEAGDEWLLHAHPNLRHERAPLLKGMLVFNVLNSVGYAAVAFAKVGPSERDTRGIAEIGIDEPVVGAMILAPALLDSYRYFRPQAHWAAWASRVVKVSSVLLVLKSQGAARRNGG